MLLALTQVLEGEVEGVQRPHVESSKCASKRKNDQEDEGSCYPSKLVAFAKWASKLTSCVRGDQQTSNCVHKSEDKVGNRKPAHINHRPAQSRLDNSVAHAHDQKQEERERVAGSVEDGDNDKEHLRPNIGAVAVQVV